MKRPGRPKVAAHTEAQRARILDAAEQRFIENGFHAATMADIAKAAGMSAGLIYRYFENKNAIVLAIIERNLEYRRARIAACTPTEDPTGELLAIFRQVQARTPRGTNAALLLETSAEATRVPEICEATAGSDRLTRGELAAWIARPRAEGGLGRSAREAQTLALLLQIVVDGLAVRSAREPRIPAARLRNALKPVARLLD